MAIYYLKFAGELSNVTDLQPLDDQSNPYEYIFKVTCTSCHETHPKAVSINRFESYDIGDSKGKANFVFRCRMCKKESSANIDRTVAKYTVEDDSKLVPILQIDARGLDLSDFVAEGRFECKGLNSGTTFNEVDLSDGEWYDYDDKVSEEVSVTEIKWEILR